MADGQEALGPLVFRRAEQADTGAIWAILEPLIREGEVFALPREMRREEAIDRWLGGDHSAYVAQEAGRIVGTFYIRPNQRGGGGHVANAGYATARSEGGRGIARAMCAHSLGEARAMGFTAMQFNFVIASNVRAIGLWQSMGFDIVGRLPKAFDHPTQGLVDALVMFRSPL